MSLSGTFYPLLSTGSTQEDRTSSQHDKTLLTGTKSTKPNNFLLFVYSVCLCHTVLSVSCSLAVTCWKKSDLLALLYVMFSCVFVTFPYDVLGQVLYLFVSIPEFCLLLYLFWFIEI